MSVRTGPPSSLPSPGRCDIVDRRLRREGQARRHRSGARPAPRAPRAARGRARCTRARSRGSSGWSGPDNYLIPDERAGVGVPFDDVDAGFRDPVTFSTSYYVPSLRAVIGRTILEMDPPDHQRYRSLIQGAFTKKEMERWERDFVRDIVESHIDTLAPLGRGDLAADFAFHYPITVIAVAAGLPVDDVPTFYEQAALLTNVAIDEAERMEASAELGAMVQTLIDRRRRRTRRRPDQHPRPRASCRAPTADRPSCSPTTRSSRSCACSSRPARRPPTAR